MIYLIVGIVALTILAEILTHKTTVALLKEKAK